MVVNTYKDYDGKVVAIGDAIVSVDILTGKNDKPLGKVTKIQKEGYLVTPFTDSPGNRLRFLGRHTRKID